MKTSYTYGHSLLQVLAKTILFSASLVLIPGMANSAETLHEFQKLTASDAAANDYFGYSVSISGDTAIIAASSDDEGGDSGSAYVFANSGGTWSQVAKLTASDPAASDWFGYSVSISGETAIVGAYRDDDAGRESGSAYVFANSGGTWSQVAKLTASDAAQGDYFGQSVSISGDTAIVGAPYDGDAGSASGSAYVFTNFGGTWNQVAKLTTSDAAQGDYFGQSVSVSGNTAIVGAWADDDGGIASGSAYVFTNLGGTWSQMAKLTASDAAQGDYFGQSVSVSGETAIVGAYRNGDAGSKSGSAYVFANSGGTWGQVAKLTASDAAGLDMFGKSVSISGETAIVGAFGDDDESSETGSAYVFTNSGGTWSQVAKLTASDAAQGDYFGQSVSISGDTAIVGAFYDDDAGSKSGSAYLYDIPEPSSMSLLGLGALGLLGFGRRKQ